DYYCMIWHNNGSVF
nr:immunoglobulin light chain junction region [Macaca mulatta]